jgi:anti-sigma B factor antagonist
MSYAEGREQRKSVRTLPPSASLTHIAGGNTLIGTLEQVAVYAPPDAFLDRSNVKRFKRDLNRLIRPGATILVNFNEVRHIDSAVCGVLLAAYRNLRAIDGEMKLFGAIPPVRALLQVLRLHRVMDVFNTQEEALRSLQI